MHDLSRTLISVLQRWCRCAVPGVLLGLFAPCTIAAEAVGQAPASFPNRPVRMVVPFAPGGFTDVVARIVGQRLTDAWGRPVIVDNRPGAAGTIAPVLVLETNADGHTLLFGSNSTFSVNPAVYGNLKYDIARDFTMAGLVAFSPHVLLVRGGLEANSVPDLVALARKQPGRVTFGSSGTGAVIHLAGELLRMRAGIDITHVPFKGGGPAATAMLAGEVDLMVNDPGPVLAHLKAGRLRALAVAQPKRTALLPTVPTFAEAGLPGVESSSWAGVAVAAKTPAAIVKRIHDTLNKVTGAADYVERLAEFGMEPLPLSTPEAADFVKRELARWTEVARAAKVRLD